MKKVMFYINAINGGGAERVMTNLASQFAENGYQTIFVTSYRAEGEYQLGEKVKRYSLENQEILQSRLKRNISRIKKLRNICKKEKPDVLIAFMAEPNFRAVLATMGVSVKTIVSVRNDPNKEYAGRVMKFVGKYILPLADGCVFQTEEAKSWFPMSLQGKSTLIYNAVKSEFYSVERNVKKGLLVTCGRLQEQKNHEMLINSVAKLHKKYPDIRLKIYGEGVLEGKLKEQINELELENIVSLQGQISNVPQALAEADMFVLSSDYEGMPNALMEAMAVGVPSISTDCPCGGSRMLLAEERGILVPVNDEEKMWSAIESLYLDDKAKLLYAAKCKEYAKRFTADKIFVQWEAFVTRIVDER